MRRVPQPTSRVVIRRSAGRNANACAATQSPLARTLPADREHQHLRGVNPAAPLGLVRQSLS
jgi:hypothetical protein